MRVPEIVINLPPNHVVPMRVCLEIASTYYAAFDIQVKAEPPRGAKGEMSPDSASVYVSSPLPARYNVLNSNFENPHLSWHGSGFIHAKGTLSGARRTQVIGGPVSAISYNEVVADYNRILSACIPIYRPNLLQIGINTRNTLFARDTPSLGRASEDIQCLVLDVTPLDGTSSIIADVFLHNRGMQFDLDKLLYGYSDGVDTPTYPMVFNTDESIFAPGVTVLLYNANGLPLGYRDFSLKLMGVGSSEKFYVSSKLANA